MRRRHSGGFSSLGLLLDTMCNAFGGVIFIAMLVAVLSQYATVRPPDDEAESSVEELEDRKESLASTIENIETEQEVTDIVADVGREELERLKELTERRDELKREVQEREQKATELGERNESVNKKIKSMKERAETLERQAEDEKKKLEELRETVADLEDAETRELTTRTMRETDKVSFWIILKSGRMYVLYRWSGYGNLSLNEEDLGILEKDEKTICDPKSGKGTSVRKDDWSGSRDVEMIVDNIPRNTVSLQFAVYPDSYGEFIKVREFFREKGYAWNWAPVSGPDEPVVFVQGGETTVQ